MEHALDRGSSPLGCSPSPTRTADQGRARRNRLAPADRDGVRALSGDAGGDHRRADPRAEAEAAAADQPGEEGVTGGDAGEPPEGGAGGFAVSGGA